MQIQEAALCVWLHARDWRAAHAPRASFCSTVTSTMKPMRPRAVSPVAAPALTSVCSGGGGGGWTRTAAAPWIRSLVVLMAPGKPGDGGGGGSGDGGSGGGGVGDGGGAGLAAQQQRMELMEVTWPAIWRDSVSSLVGRSCSWRTARARRGAEAVTCGAGTALSV
eukprot:5450410-Prymnesium_polylepis.2